MTTPLRDAEAALERALLRELRLRGERRRAAVARAIRATRGRESRFVILTPTEARELWDALAERENGFTGRLGFGHRVRQRLFAKIGKLFPSSTGST